MLASMHQGRSSLSDIPETMWDDSIIVTSPTTPSSYYYGYYPVYPVYSMSQDGSVYNVYHTWPATSLPKKKIRIPELVDAEDQDVQNGSSTVAIDNKIEQAMDLVKSHLMYAVREEVEVLKEQIKELMDKNQQLEYENQILKNSASPETLAKLSNMPPSSST